MPPKKRFSVLLYPDEYEMLLQNTQEKGYKKTEYFLACMTAAKKQSMEAVCKRYAAEHKERGATRFRSRRLFIGIFRNLLAV